MYYSIWWFVIDMLLAGMSIGVAIWGRDRWVSVFNWVVAFLMLALAAIQFTYWLESGG